MFKVALDAGHGLKTVGKQTPDGIKEWTLNDNVRDLVAQELADYNCELINTDNNEGSVDESLASRVNRYLDVGADLFVSIHHNAFTGVWNSATGVEVYTDSNPTADDTRLAELIYSRLVSYTGLRGRGVKRADFYVINQNKIPAVLCEGGFMDSTKDYAVITSSEGQQAYARAVAEGIIEFLGLETGKTSTPAPQPMPVPEASKPDVIYQIWDDVQNRWLPNVKNMTDYAGLFGHDVCCVFANSTAGNLYYRVHIKGGNWLPEVKNRSDYAGLYNRPIDAFMIKSDSGRSVRYRTHLRRQNRWLPWVTGYSTRNSANGYAGILGQEIDAVQIEFV